MDRHKQPKSFYIILFAEASQRFSFWGLMSIIVLLLTKHLGFSDSKAFTIYGIFTAMAFSYSIIGGYLADKFYGFRKTFLTGLILSLIGNVVLIVDNSAFLYLGLAFIACGLGLFLPSNSNLLGCFYEKNDPRREGGFSLLYMSTNVGGLLGPVFYGLAATYLGWKYSFALSAIFLCLTLYLFSLRNRYFDDKGLSPLLVVEKKSWGLTNPTYYLLLLSLILLSVLFFNNPRFSFLLMVIASIAALTYIYVKLTDKSKVEKKNTCFLLMAILFALIFFAVVFQIYTSLTEFIENFVNRKVSGFILPTSSFASLEPFFVIILSSCAAYLWNLFEEKKYKISILTKFSIGMILAGIGLLIIALSAYYVWTQNQSCPPLFIVLGSLFLGASEICIMPPLISSITKLSPPNLKGVLMGMLYLSLGFSGYLSSVIAKLTKNPHVVHQRLFDDAQAYFHVYEHLFYLCIVLAIALLLMSFLLRRETY